MTRSEMLKRVQHDVEGIELAYEVILNLVQDLTEDWLVKARGEMLKRVIRLRSSKTSFIFE